MYESLYYSFGDDSNSTYILIMASDFYRVIMLFILTFVVLDELQKLKKTMQRIFNDKQTHSSDEAKIQSLTLMLVSNTAHDLLTPEMIAEFENEHNAYDLGGKSVIGCYHIPNLHRAYDLLSELKMTRMGREVYQEIDLSDFSKKWVPENIKSALEFTGYKDKMKTAIEKEVSGEVSKTGITFISFKSADSLMRFREYIKRRVNQTKPAQGIGVFLVFT